MTSTQVSASSTSHTSGSAPVPLRLEVVVLPVVDVERAKNFYTNLGWRLDADASVGDDYRVVQLTPPASNASIIFGNGVTYAEPGLGGSVVLVVDDIDEARADLRSRGVDVSEVFHDAGGGLAGGFQAGTAGRASGPDPEGRSYASYATFDDPEGNHWLLQGITTRLPGRLWS